MPTLIRTYEIPTYPNRIDLGRDENEHRLVRHGDVVYRHFEVYEVAGDVYKILDTDDGWEHCISRLEQNRAVIDLIRQAISYRIFETSPRYAWDENLIANYETIIPPWEMQFRRLNSIYEVNVQDLYAPRSNQWFSNQVLERYRNCWLDQCVAQPAPTPAPMERLYDESSRMPVPIRRNRKHHFLTWVPYSSYHTCAKCFSDSDLKSMRVRILRVLRALKNERVPHRVNKRVELWRGFDQSLIRYGIAIALECRRRGFNDTSLEKFQAEYIQGVWPKPQWVFWEAMQESHRSYLLLRGERALASRLIASYWKQRNVSHRGLRSYCQENYLIPLKEWTKDQTDCIKHVMFTHMPDRVGVDSNFYSQQNWFIEPRELLRYPGDNICSV